MECNNVNEKLYKACNVFLVKGVSEYMIGPLLDQYVFSHLPGNVLDHGYIMTA
jgi:hypothetical protein